MMRNRTSLLLRLLYNRSSLNCRLCSSANIQAQWQKDPAPVFFHKNVQSLLKVLTRMDLEKTFRVRKDGTPLSSPTFQFMTEEELEKSNRKVHFKAAKRLQMPPVVMPEEDTVRLLSDDPALQGPEESKYVFTDISFGRSNKNRLIVVREPDGKLRHAFINERNRMNQVYFPIKGREIRTPTMFSYPYLKDLMNRDEYEYILDRTCIQFEPNDLEFHRITKEVYTDVNMKNRFNILRSTRHFGPLAFYLAWENRIDNLLVDTLENNHIKEAVALIQLYHIIHPDCKSAASKVYEDSGIELIKSYAELDSTNRHNVEYAILSYEKLQSEKQKVEEGIIKAHGLNTNATNQKRE